MDAHQALVQGRNLLSDPACWRQCTGTYGEGGPTYCAQEAIHMPNGDYLRSEVYLDASMYLSRAILGERSYRSIPSWNDDPERTHAEVLAAFDKAIAQTAPEPDTEFLNNVAEPVAA